MAKTTLFINVESDDLIHIFDDPSIKKNVEHIFETILDKKLKSISANEAVLDFDETLKLLGIKKGTLYKWTAECFIPHYKKGGKLFFIKEDLVGWIKSGKIKTNAELDEEAEKFIRKRNQN